MAELKLCRCGNPKEFRKRYCEECRNNSSKSRWKNSMGYGNLLKGYYRDSGVCFQDYDSIMKRWSGYKKL